MDRLLNIILALLPSAAILLLALWLRDPATSLEPQQLAIIKWIPLTIYALGLGLSFKFNRGNMFFVMANLTLAYILLCWYMPGASEYASYTTYALICVLLPVNLLIGLYLPDLGSRAIWRQTRFIIIVVELVVGGLTVALQWTGLASLLWSRLTDSDVVNATPMPQLGLVAMLTVMFVAYGRAHAQPTVSRCATFAAVIAVAMALHAELNTAAVITSLGAAAIILLIALGQESWNIAYIDPLTSLPGRRALEEFMQHLQGKFVIAMVDVDHFKRFNDTYGHEVGDEVLRMVAAQLRDIEGNGKVYRYGGEEFTILFPGMSLADVRSYLDNLRQHIAASRFELRQRERRRIHAGSSNGANKIIAEDISITVSIGAAESGNGLHDSNSVRSAADKALYDAKQQGRNRLCT
ncbi:MAG: GGDEF domain-containing protein [Gammaproteobacteria bacterium]|nr:GGDEF domain-containing protein [Gammaproteobacteria bacterium]